MSDKKVKIFVATPTTGSVVDSQAYLLRDIAELYKDHVEFIYPDLCVRRIFHDYARNELVGQFLDSKADILWFLDSDITPSKHILDLVIMHKDKWEVAGATYPVFMNTDHSPNISVVFTVYKKNESTGNFGLREAPKTGQEFVDGLATGCLFIKREVFAKLEKPYFEFKYENESRKMEEGEDLGFCRKLSALGIKFFTDFELVCRHQKEVDLLDVNNYAIEYANAAVLRYDAAIKEQLTVAINVAFEKGLQEGIKTTVEQMSKKSKIITQDKTIWTPAKL